MKLHADLVKALNDQMNLEFQSAYAYLGMAAYFEEASYPGFASWMRLQGTEELGHARKFFQYIVDRGAKMVLEEISAPVMKYKSVLEVFETSLAQEQKVSESIINIYELASKNRDYATQSFLKWFLDEQVEEEKTVGEIIGQINVLGSTPNVLFQMDREAGRRSTTK